MAMEASERKRQHASMSPAAVIRPPRGRGPAGARSRRGTHTLGTVLCETVPFDHVLGQPTAVATITRALRSARLHHAYRFEGPDGVGKELVAVAFAQALLCTAATPLGCGACDACRRVAATSPGDAAASGGVPLHPDFVVVERGLYRPEAIGRTRPELTEISVDQIRRVVLAHAGYAPHEGRARVFLVRAAEELSISAANALLKVLEEPRPGTHFVLLTSAPERLLPTIRSRTLPVRFGPLPDDALRTLLAARATPDAESVRVIALADGSASQALAAADPEIATRRDRFVAEARAAIDAPTLGPAVSFGEALERDRDRIVRDLGALGADFASQARREVGSDPAGAERAAERHELVLHTAAAIARNASPSLAWLGMVAAMRRRSPA